MGSRRPNGRHEAARLAIVMWGAATSVYLALLFRPPELLISRPFQEDAYYALSHSRALVDEPRSLANNIQAEFGVPPLMNLVNAPAFYVMKGRPMASLRLCLLMAIGFYGLAALVIGASIRSCDRDPEPVTFWLPGVLVYCNYTLSVVFLSGLDTALAVFLVFATFLYSVRCRKSQSSLTVRRSILLGSLCGLCMAARMESAIFAAALALSNAVVPHRRVGNPAGTWRRRVLESAAILASAAVVSSPWWLGHLPHSSIAHLAGARPIQPFEIEPMSARIATLRVLSHQCLGVLHLATRHNHVGTSNIAGLTLLGGMAVFSLAVPRLRSRVQNAGTAWRKRWDLGSLMPLWIFSAYLMFAYTMFPDKPHLQSNNLIVPRILFLFLLTSFGVSVLQTFSRWRIYLRLALVSWGLISLAPHARSFVTLNENERADQAEWVRRNTGARQRVGIFRSGVTGYLYPDRVVNLDGNISSDALIAVRTRHLSEFLGDRRVEYLMDRPEYLALAWQDTALARRAVQVTTLNNDIEVWALGDIRR